MSRPTSREPGGRLPAADPESEAPEPFSASLPPEGVDETALVRAAQAGDALAMAQLIDVLASQVGRVCGPIALDDAGDAAQEALLSIFRDLKTLREPQALRGWVRRIAMREAIRHAQRGRREPALGALAEELPTRDDPALARDVRDVLQSLSPEQRAILVLRDLEGLSEHEAAAQLEVARGTVKSRLHRARAAFSKRWRA